ncbi:MAG: sulfite exporter TauE/SafE family protein [Sandaracinus sp.]|nr:sulfite exporter TauE/SafE family protein [Sandaracinus sp.]
MRPRRSSWCRRTPLATPALRLAAPAGALGLAFGLHYVAPVVSGPAVKLFFCALWGAFALAHHHASKRGDVQVEADVLSRPSSQVWLVVAGLIGGVVSSLVGTGLDIVVFAVLVLRLGVSETVATPTSVVLMAIGSALGFALRASSGGPTPKRGRIGGPAFRSSWSALRSARASSKARGVASCRACSTRRWWRRRSARSSCCRSRRACSPSRRPPSCSASSSSSASRVRARGWPRCRRRDPRRTALPFAPRGAPRRPGRGSARLWRGGVLCGEGSTQLRRRGVLADVGRASPGLRGASALFRGRRPPGAGLRGRYDGTGDPRTCDVSP